MVFFRSYSGFFHLRSMTLFFPHRRGFSDTRTPAKFFVVIFRIKKPESVLRPEKQIFRNFKRLGMPVFDKD